MGSTLKVKKTQMTGAFHYVRREGRDVMLYYRVSVIYNMAASNGLSIVMSNMWKAWVFKVSKS